jgi:hypothetical protein
MARLGKWSLKALVRSLTVAAWLAAPCMAAAEESRDIVGEFWGIELLGRTPHYLDIGVGVFDVFTRDRDSKRSASGRLEVRIGKKLFGFGPLFGLMANTDGGVNGYGGLYADFAIGNVIVTPMGAVSGYSQGDSSYLGGVFLFRIGLGAAYEFENKVRVGVNISHLSNASTRDDNPGEEEIYLTVALPF